jgi:hypothetical protein
MTLNRVNVTYFVYHIALWVPMLIDVVPIDLDKLFQYSGSASSTTYSELN